MTRTAAKQVTKPAAKYGKERLKIVFQPVEGKAIPMKAGEVLRITQLGNGQCVDFNCFNLHDYKEMLSVGFTRMHSFRPKQGDFLWSNPPRSNPLMAIVEMPASCVTDTLHARCNAYLFEDYYGFDLHTNCQDTFAAAVGEYRLTPDDVHDAFNLWMDTGWDDQGNTVIRRITGRKGDYVDMMAMMDVLAVPILCGSGDVQPTAAFFPKPIQVQVFESSPATKRQCKEMNARLKLKNNRELKDFAVQEILATRELKRDPEYKPKFVNFPLQFTELEVELDETGYGQLQRLRFAEYQEDEEILREAVMRWLFRNRTRRGRLKASAGSK
jgi:uncharacterized protein YcgI (DUF1989 family)